MAAMRLMRPKRSTNYWRPESRILRSIQAPQHVADEAGEIRISSAALVLSDGDASCSVDAEQLLHEDRLSSDALYPALPRSVGLYALEIAQARSESVETHHDPIWSNWYHAGLRGDALKKHKVRKRLAKLCVPVVPLDEGEVRRLRAEAEIKRATSEG